MSRYESLQVYHEADQFVFHGSANGTIEVLEPRQAHSFEKPDGEPAVFAASDIAPAIFMAVLGSRHVAGWDSSKFIKPFGFYISETPWRQAHDEQWSGFVYVLDRSTFTKDAGWVWRSHDKVTPLARFAVAISDLPEGITIMSDEAEAAYRKANTPT